MIIEIESPMKKNKTENKTKNKTNKTPMDGINSRLNTIKERISEMEVRIRKIIQKTAHREKNLQSIERNIIVNV